MKKYCEKCEKEINDQEAKFCPDCGTLLSEKQQDNIESSEEKNEDVREQVVIKYCEKCAKEINDQDAKFCPDCGTPLSEKQQDNIESSEEKNEDVREQVIVKYCKKCEKEISDQDAKFCPDCGSILIAKMVEKSINFDEKINKENNQEKIKKLLQGNKIAKKWKIIGAVGICIIAVLLISLLGKDNTEEVIQKLSGFTYTESEQDRYVFQSSEGWRLIYTDVNTVVEFDEGTISDFLVYAFGTYATGDDGTFSYDLDDNEVRIYMDITTEEGHFSILNYNLDNGDLYFNKDGDKYEASQEFIDAITDYGLLDYIKMDVGRFKSNLNNYDLSVEDLEDVQFKNIGKYIMY